MTIAMLLDMAASGYGERVFVGPSNGGLTFARLADRAARGAALLRNSGAGHVVFVGSNGPAFPTLIYASALAGLPLSPINYRLGAIQLSELIGTLGRPIVVADDRYLGGLGSHQAIATEDWLAQAELTPAADPADVDDDDAAIILFTSGTTSKPKAVVLRHSHLVAYVVQTIEFGSASSDDVAFISVPPYHVAGCTPVLTNLYAGRRIVYLADFSPEAWLELASAERVTSAMVVPTMLARIVEYLDGAHANLPSLRTLAYGGARMPQTVLERALHVFGDTGFVNAYGLTETSSTIALLRPEDHRAALNSDDPAERSRLSSVGRLVPGVEGEIRDDVGNLMPMGEVGELWVRGAQVSGEYRGLEQALDADGWFPTRDRAWFDDEGYLFIEGRADDTIIRGGENIAPAEIEDVLMQHPAVREVAVVGLPDEEWGERTAAVVVPSLGASPSEQELFEWVRARLRRSRTPDEVFFVQELPRTDTGKVIRRLLIEQLAAMSQLGSQRHPGAAS